jgi:hypothetical protein
MESSVRVLGWREGARKLNVFGMATRSGTLAFKG